jgi:hypothetical protein
MLDHNSILPELDLFSDCKIEIVEPDTPLLKKNKLGRLGKMI